LGNGAQGRKRRRERRRRGISHGLVVKLPALTVLSYIGLLCHPIKPHLAPYISGDADKYKSMLLCANPDSRDKIKNGWMFGCKCLFLVLPNQKRLILAELFSEILVPFIPYFGESYVNLRR
jgi:hypothetical protein